MLNGHLITKKQRNNCPILGVVCRILLKSQLPVHGWKHCFVKTYERRLISTSLKCISKNLTPVIVYSVILDLFLLLLSSLLWWYDCTSVLFQVFVANPNKALPIQEILVKNKDKLVEFLTNFHNDRTGIDITVDSVKRKVRLKSFMWTTLSACHLKRPLVVK